MSPRGISRPVAHDISGDDRPKSAGVSASRIAAAGDGTLANARALIRSWNRGSWSDRWLAVRRSWAALRAREASLELWRDGSRLQRLPLGAERIRIGRDPLCELVADAEGISRVHCFVERDHPGDRDPCLEDFNSANGVFWRDQRIRAIRLRHGDAVRLGSALAGAPTLRYVHPRSGLERLAHWGGITALSLSGLAMGGLLLASSIAGGSHIRAIGGPVKIVSADGRQIDGREGSATALPSLHDYPLQLRQALLASEDSRFGWNSGLDLFGTLRSLVRRSGGGSGLTQQVARIYYPSVGNDYSLTRKLRELWMAWQLETGFSKNDILKMYLDRAHLGLGADGFEQGAQLYFRKSARQLDLAESAFLVGLLPLPNGYSPCYAPSPQAVRTQREERQHRSGRPEKVTADESIWIPKLRRDLVLERMHEDGYISDQQLIDARRRPLNTDPSACRQSSFISYPFFSDYVAAELTGTRFALNLDAAQEGGNYHVVSTINPRLQALAQKQLRAFLDTKARPLGITQAALIAIDFQSGNILAYVGGGDYKQSSFDRVQALRQPGSTFKLFTYLAALEAGVGQQDAISCAPLSYVAGCSHGPVGGDGRMSVADGFAYSENVVALRLADKAGLDQVIRRARQLGISTPLEPSYSMVLGGRETLLYEMARAYAVVANGGLSVPMHGVERIYDLGICKSALNLAECAAGGVTTPIGEKPQQLIDPQVAGALDGLLRRVVLSGTGRNAAVVADARGKTGTTNDGVDVWFIGYSPASGILTGIWMGNDDNRPADYASGALAAQLWGEFMNKVGDVAGTRRSG
jgi:penicillin-binding protein 1A